MLHGGRKKGYDILRGNIRLDVVAGGEKVSPAFS
jgi:hypothetical protein